MCVPSLVIFAPCTGICFEVVDCGFNVAKAIVARIIPARIEDHRRCEKLGAGKAALAAGHRAFVVCQAPSGIEGLAEDAGFVSGKNRFEPDLRRHGIDADRALKKRPGRIGRVAEFDAVGLVLWAEISGPVALGGFGVCFDKNATTGVLLLCKDKHFPKSGIIGSARGHRGIATGLVDHKDIARIRKRQGWVHGAIFGQVGLTQAGDCGAGAVEEVGVVKRRSCQKRFKIGGGGRVEMRPFAIEEKTDGRLFACAARQERT